MKVVQVQYNAAMGRVTSRMKEQLHKSQNTQQ